MPVLLALLQGVVDYNRFISIPYWSVFSYCYLFQDDASQALCSPQAMGELTKWTAAQWRWDLEDVAQDSNTPVPELLAADFSYDALDVATKGVPVVVRGLFNNTAATTKWTPEYFEERYGDDILIILTEGRPDVQYRSSLEANTVTGKGAGYQNIMQPVKMMLKNAIRRMRVGLCGVVLK